MTDASEAPGWDAITAVFERLYPGQKERHFGTAMASILGGDDPLQGISVYTADRGRPHWHYVTYGFSDLYETSNDGDESGYGFELTLRLARGDEAEPPAWAINLLQNIARYVFKSGNGFEAGHYMDANGPIAVGTGTKLTTLFFAQDDEAGRIETPNGTVDFLQLIGATREEYDAAQRWRTGGIVDLLRERDPVLVTDLTRESVLTPDNLARVEAALAKEGSNCGLLYLDKVEVAEDRMQLILGARGVNQLHALLPYRLPFERDLALMGKDHVVAFKPGTACRIARIPHGLEITLTIDAVDPLLASLPAKAGDYRFAACPGLTITVVPSPTLDAKGNVIDMIG